MTRAVLSELPAAAHASRGLLRRRYSAPETVMRKYWLAQSRSESEEYAEQVTSVSPASPRPPPAGISASCACGDMRRSALLRRLWARVPSASPPPVAPRAPRSLDSSRCELRPLSPRRPLTPSTCEPSRTDPAKSDCDCCESTPRDEALHSETSPRDQQRYVHAPVVPPSSDSSTFQVVSDDRSESDSYPTSVTTTKESPSVMKYQPIHNTIDLPVRPLRMDVPAYEVLEIVISESSNDSASPAMRFPSPGTAAGATSSSTLSRQVDIDEYVSNILVESLNSLSDQIESMNASIASDRKISIVEKEIKVRLQNAGVNTMVHLSPTSNNQIIFGNEELCAPSNTEKRDSLAIREESPLSNNLTPPEPPDRDRLNNAVLHQIQRLFRDEMHSFTERDSSEISHIEISNVDVFIDENMNPSSLVIEHPPAPEMVAESSEVVGIVSGTYWGACVSRVCGPRSGSLEVQASGSEPERTSDCASLVDSLDDPTSPRAPPTPGPAAQRPTLVRSHIDVLDLLPDPDPSQEVVYDTTESVVQNMDISSIPQQKENEAFFIRLNDDKFEPDQGDIPLVADFMPEKIKQRLLRRQRRRELRMESARREKCKLESSSETTGREKREVPKAVRLRRERDSQLNREGGAVLAALIDDVIAKIVQDEFKCMRIKQRPERITPARSDENISKRSKKRDTENGNRLTSKIVRNNSSSNNGRSIADSEPSQRRPVRGRLSLRPPASPETAPRRIYQKSEIHDGDKCIEILEILEYSETSNGSTETINSDENHNYTTRSKKSRIPVLERRRSVDSPPASPQGSPPPAPPPSARRASVPSDARAVRFQRVFDMIPEERSLSLSSGEEEPSHRSPLSLPLGAAPRVRSTTTMTSPRVRSATTMTSPPCRSTATSPRAPPAPPRAARASPAGMPLACR